MIKLKHRIASIFLSVTMLVTSAAGLSAPASAIDPGKVVWDTGVAAFGEFVPHGRAFAPVLTALGSLLGISGTSAEMEKLKEVCKKIDGLSNDIKNFRADMNTRLDELDRRISDIDAKLNKIQNEIFISGVGSELDTLHTQIAGGMGKLGIAAQVDQIYSDPTMDENVKAIEIAYLIGGNKEWNETQNALFRLKNVSDLVGGKTYRDTNGRNLYQVLYDDIVPDCMFTGEVYDTMEPYIDRVMSEYFYTLTVLTQCLSSSLAVSQMSDEQVHAYGDAVYQRYLSCKSPTSLVKQQLDGLSSQLLDATSPNSIISLYAIFKYKKENDRLVYINRGTTEIQLEKDLAEHKSDESIWWYTGREKGIDYLDNDSIIYFFQFNKDFPMTEPKLNKYYKEHKEFIESSDKLAPSDIKNIYDYFLPKNISFMDYLGQLGFSTDDYKSDGSYFPVSTAKGSSAYVNKKMKPDGALYISYLNIYYDSFDPRKSGDNPLTRNIIGYKQTYSYTLNFLSWKTYWTKKWYADIILGLKKSTSGRNWMPATAAEIYPPTVRIAPCTPYSVYTHYGFKLSTYFDVYITENGSPERKIDVNNDNEYYKFGFEVMEASTGKVSIKYDKQIWFSDDAENGTYHIRAWYKDKHGRVSYSDWIELEFMRNGHDYKAYLDNINAFYHIKYYIEPAKSTEFNFTVKETILSNNELTEKTRDKNWVYQNYKVEWQYYLPQDGIETMITVARGINFIKEGIYKVRVKITASDGTVAFSNWIDVKTSNYKKALSYTVTGSFSGIVGADPELVENAGEGDNGFNVSVPDDLGYYLWEALETDGIIITELGLVSFTKPGTYHVRIVSGVGDYVSDWYEITARYPYTPQQPSFVPSSTSSTTTSVPSDTSAQAETAAAKPVLRVSAADDHSITVSWDKINGAEKYTLYVKKGDSYTKVVETQKTKVRIVKTTNNRTYEYMLRWTKGGVESSENDAPTASVKIYWKPAVKASSADGKVILKWAKVPDATKYRVYRYTNGKLSKIADTEANAVRISNVTAGKTYSYAVKAYVDGVWTKVSDSDIVSVKVK